MKARYLFIAAALLVAALLLWLVLRPAERAHFELPTFGEEAPAGMPGTAQAPAAATPEAAMPEEYSDIELDPDAIASLRGARELGYDPRTPPIGRDAPPEQPSEEELADPEKYAEFEARQERKIKRAYVIEAEKYVRQLREDIEKGKAMGIPPDEIAKVQEKVRRIEEMRAQLLAADPGLLGTGGP